jgi:hypothetical protein
MIAKDKSMGQSIHPREQGHKLLGSHIIGNRNRLAIMLAINTDHQLQTSAPVPTVSPFLAFLSPSPSC